MGYLTVISETGMFHSACLFEMSGSKQWRGFHPSAHRSPIGAGEVDTSNREPYINHYVRFEVSDLLLQQALLAVDAGYGSAYYALGVQDCVSLSANVARNCHLAVPAVNLTPYGLLWALRTYNPYVNHDTRPFPWNSAQ